MPSATLSPPEDDQLVNEFEIHRLKGLIYVVENDKDTSSNRMDGSADTLNVKMIQGVRDIFEITAVPHAPDQEGGSMRQGKMVIIGRGLGEAAVWQRSLDNLLQSR